MFVVNFTPMNSLFELVNHWLTITTSLLLLFLLILIFRKTSHKVFLLDFACYKPPANQMCNKEQLIEIGKLYCNFTDEKSEIFKKGMDRAGVGDSTYLPEALVRKPPNPCRDESRREMENAMFKSIDTLLKKTGVPCKKIRIVIVNCCVLNVVPSLCSMIVNHYKLSENVICYNLGGMGCAAGLVAIGLAKQILKVHHNSYALVVSSESITENIYKGNDHSMLIGNCIFRLGGAAILLSNRPSDYHSSKYQLIHTVNTHTAKSDISYNCIFQKEDEDGEIGFTITKDLLVAASEAIKSNIKILAPLILPVSEKIYFLANYTKRRLYTPNFSKAVDHFFPHVGGKPVLDALQKNLGFSDDDMEASRMTLYRFGNTSSSSLWYEVAYAEAKGRVKKGDYMWQIAFGSGFKCSSAVWRAIRTVDYEETNPWSEEIDEFPLDPSKLGSTLESSLYHFEPPK